MAGNESTSTWLHKLQEGDEAAAQRLWEQYYHQLIRVAYQRLASWPRRVADEEDVVLSAIDSFCRAAANGRFPQLSDNDDVWRLLMAFTARKICDYQRQLSRAKRGGGRVFDQSVLAPGDGSRSLDGIERVIGREPSPELIAEWTESLRYLLEQLGDKQLERIALLKLEGYANQEIAELLPCSLRSVERKLHGIRSIWSQAEDRD